MKYCELVVFMIMNVIMTRKIVRLLLVSLKKVRTLNLVFGFVHAACENAWYAAPFLLFQSYKI